MVSNMEVESPRIDDEQSLLEERGLSSVEQRRFWPYLSAFGIVVVVGVGVYSTTSSVASQRAATSHVDDVTSMYHAPWHAAWRDRPRRIDEDGCTWDGDDCWVSRCCANAGSRCYMKSQHWASCNNTCSHDVKWQAGHDRRGQWVVTSYPVWSCVDLTVTKAVTKVVTTHVRTHAPHPEIVVVAQPTKFGIYEQEDDYDTKDYAVGAAPAARAVSSTHAPVTWEGLH